MSPIKIDPVSDPLFQLNVLLWLTQPLPQGSQMVYALYGLTPEEIKIVEEASL